MVPFKNAAHLQNKALYHENLSELRAIEQGLRDARDRETHRGEFGMCHMTATLLELAALFCTLPFSFLYPLFLLLC